MKFTPAKRGEPISMKAREWNAVREATLASEINSASSRGVSVTRRNVMVMNDQQEAVPAFGVLAVTETLYDQQGLSNQAAMGLSEWVRVKSGAPTGEENEILCVVQRAAQPTHLQPAIVMGPTLAWVYVNDTGHCYAKAIPDNANAR